MSLTVAVDFDGVIHRYSKGWQGGAIYDPPTDGAMEALVSLLKKFNVTIFTTRDDLKKVATWLERQLKEHRVLTSNESLLFPDDGVFQDSKGWHVALMYPGESPNAEHNSLIVTNRKPIAFVYIDDRAIRFTNWPDVLKYFG